MNRVSALLVLALLIFSGCKKWRPKEYPSPNDVLPSAVWQLEEHLQIAYDPMQPDCRLPIYAVYNKDKSGYFCYPTPCDTVNGVDTLRFTWEYKPNNQRIYYQFSNGNGPGLAEAQFITCDYDMVRSTCRTDNYNYLSPTETFIDGNFRPIKN